mmetsp:Transcript_13527/g.37502  ORF Transcript_13527/g.37502 Transcript_13527/m.37502 type:complete len:154 (-) Transcript_13527:2-463(-)
MGGEPAALADFAVEGRVARNRLHGRRLLWIKVVEADSEFAVVFDARTYPHDVALVSKTLSLGDRGCFRGVLRSCGKIVDARSFTVFERTPEDDAWLRRRVGLARGLHAAAEPQANEGAEPCKYWLSNGRCSKGRPCECAHPRGDALARARAGP